MKFEEIFQQEGLYFANSFIDGVCIEISQNYIDGRKEMTFVKFGSVNSINATELSDIKVYDELFKKEYHLVLNRKQLFRKK